MLTKVKDTLPLGKQSYVVYMVYIGETKQRLETRTPGWLQLGDGGEVSCSRACILWENHHPIHLEETTVLDHGRGQELLVKEALHIQMILTKEHFN